MSATIYKYANKRSGEKSKWTFYVGEQLHTLWTDDDLNWYDQVDGSNVVNVSNIDSFVEEHKTYLIAMEENLTLTEKLRESLTKMLKGVGTCTNGVSYGWWVRDKVKFRIDRYKSPKEKTICLEQLGKNGVWKTTMVDETKLKSFLKRNTKLFVIDEDKCYENPEQTPTHPFIVEPLLEKIDKAEMLLTELVLSEDEDQVVCKRDTRDCGKTHNSSIFIHLPKQKRIMVQSCKRQEHLHMEALVEAFGKL